MDRTHVVFADYLLFRAILERDADTRLPMLRAVSEILEQKTPRSDDLLAAAGMTAITLRDLGKLDQALAAFDHAIELSRQDVGPQNWRHVVTCYFRASTAFQAGKFEQSNARL